jgi:hypothetical protein
LLTAKCKEDLLYVVRTEWQNLDYFYENFQLFAIGPQFNLVLRTVFPSKPGAIYRPVPFGKYFKIRLFPLKFSLHKVFSSFAKIP